MISSEAILLELQEVSPALINISRENLYSVPLHYFDGLAGDITALCKGESAGVFLPVTAAPFTVPDQYFEGLADSILGKINAGTVDNEISLELAAIAPLLNTLSKSMPFEVPTGYFEGLSTRVEGLKRLENKPARVVPFSFKKVYRYAVAAVVTGVVAVSTFLLYPDDNDLNNQPNVSAVVNIAAAVDKMSDDDIISYLEQNTTASEMVPMYTIQDEDIDINGIIETVSEEEIKEYLKQFEGPQRSKAKES